MQEHTAPESELDIHQTQMAEGATRVMPANRISESFWYDPDTLGLAAASAARHDVQGIVTRQHLPEGTVSPAARYTVALRSSHTGDSGRTFIYETGDQYFEQTTPTIAEALTEAADYANVEHGAVTDEGHDTVLDNLIAVLGEHDARDLLAHSYVKNGQLSQI